MRFAIASNAYLSARQGELGVGAASVSTVEQLATERQQKTTQTDPPYRERGDGRRLSHPGEKIAQFVDFDIGQRLRDRAHGAGRINPAPIPEVPQLFRQVGVLLPGNARERVRCGLAVARVTSGAACPGGARLAARRLARIWSEPARMRFDRSKKSGKIAHVLQAQLRRDGVHARIVAPPVLELRQLLQQIGLRLAGEYRVMGFERPAVEAVAARAVAVLALACSPILGADGRGEAAEQQETGDAADACC